jgi:probable rRNA maturation factor
MAETQVFVADEQSERPVDAERFGQLARQVLADRGVRGEAELNILFVDEETIATLNERFLGKTGPTDVLSFPIEDDIAFPAPPGGPLADLAGPGREGTSLAAEETAPLLIGDVVVCPAVAWRNAPQHAGTYEDELALLIVHGVLHLLGMDHEVEAEAEQMEALEAELLARYHL